MSWYGYGDKLKKKQWILTSTCRTTKTYNIRNPN